MAITVKHKFVSTIPDGTDATVVRPSNWNDDHDLTGTIPVANGGTGASTADGALTNILPSQTGNNGKYLTTDGTNTSWSANASGDVVGPSSATDNAVARFDTTTGKLIQNSVTLIDDTGNASGILSQQFSNGSAVTLAAGKMWYDGSTGAWNAGMGGGNITQQIGEELFIYGKASAAITDSPLQIVYHTGTVGASGVITFAPTIAGITDENAIIGVATESLALNGFGRVTAFGVVHGITTNGAAFGETWADDDVIWYNPVTGNPTKVKPSAPNIKFQIGLVIKAGAGGSGSFQVNLVQGTALGGTDSNVQVTSVANGNLLTYDGGNGYWKNTDLAAGTGISVSKSTNGVLTVTNTSPSSGGTVTSVGGTGTVSGISLSGTVTSSGNLTLGGSLDLSSPPAIGGTTPAAGTFTTITGQTEVLKGTGSNLLLQSNSFTNAAWNTSSASVTVTGGQSDPFGGSTAFLVVPSVSNIQHALYNVNNPYSGLATPYTVSIYVKASGYTLFYISDIGSQAFACSYNLSAVTATPTVGCTGTITAVSGATGWYRVTLTTTVAPLSSSRLTIVGYASGASLTGYGATFAGDGTSGVVVYGGQVEFGSTVGSYIATTTTAVYGTPTLSFSGVSTIGLQSDGSLYVSPAGTGALQAQATTSSTVGGNARGSNATDWQTSRASASQVASSSFSTIGGGANNTASTSNGTTIAGGRNNNSTAQDSFVGGGNANTASGLFSSSVGGASNVASGYYGFVGSGQTNSTTSNSAVTTQSGTMNATTAVTLSGSNASIKVGQYITGTSIANNTYVSAISGTSLTLSQAASGSSTSTLSFYTPHGVVVGGGNNQATGSYSFIGGGGDAGTAANRNVASGDWSVVCGGRGNSVSGVGSFIGGGGLDGGASALGNSATGIVNFVGGGLSNGASLTGSAILGGYQNTANSSMGSILGGRRGTTRGISGNAVIAACNIPIANANGVSQSAILILAKETTDATATALTSDTSAASGTNQVILPNNSAYFFRGEVVSGVTGGGDTKGWSIEGVIKRGAGVGTTALVGTPTVTSMYADVGAATWTIAVTADTTNGGLRVTFTGQAATTIRTVCQIRTTEMTY